MTRLTPLDLINALSELSANPVSTREDKRRPVWTVDSETDPFKKGRVPAPFIWGVYTGDPDHEELPCPGGKYCGDGYYEFYDTENLVIFLSQQYVVVYAHNGGKFDWHYITEWIDDYEPLTVINGRLAKFQIGLCEFRDSFNIIPAPLSAYKKDDIDYLIFEKAERDKPENWLTITVYLKSDCVYLHEMVTAFIAEYGTNLTQASAAMKFWSKHSKIKKPKSSPLYYEDMSRYYYGGRVECFEAGIIDRPFKVADIKSAYPRAMMDEHPWGGIYRTLDHMPEGMTDAQIGRSFITLTTNALGAFPMRLQNGLAFPNHGKPELFFTTGWEYLAARDTNTLGNPAIHEVRIYDESINFIKYVKYFYQMKLQAEQSGDLVRRLFAKLFLNSLYGKFASNPENYEEWMTLPSHLIDAAHEEDGWFLSRIISEDTVVVNRPLPEEKRRYYDVAVSASITGWVRAYLWRSIRACSGVLYCDTDSIAATSVDGLQIGDSLGNWSIDANCDRGAIAGKKLYAFHTIDDTWKTASKGVRLTPEEIYQIANGESVTFEPEVPTYSLKQGIKFTPRTIKMLAEPLAI